MQKNVYFPLFSVCVSVIRWGHSKTYVTDRWLLTWSQRTVWLRMAPNRLCL